MLGARGLELQYCGFSHFTLSPQPLNNSCSYTCVPTSLFLRGGIFPLYFIVYVSHTRCSPLRVLGTVCYSSLRAGAKTSASLAHTGLKKCLLNLFERFARELP